MPNKGDIYSEVSLVMSEVGFVSLREGRVLQMQSVDLDWVLHQKELLSMLQEVFNSSEPLFRFRRRLSGERQKVYLALFDYGVRIIKEELEGREVSSQLQPTKKIKKANVLEIDGEIVELWLMTASNYSE